MLAGGRVILAGASGRELSANFAGGPPKMPGPNPAGVAGFPGEAAEYQSGNGLPRARCVDGCRHRLRGRRPGSNQD